MLRTRLRWVIQNPQDLLHHKHVTLLATVIEKNSETPAESPSTKFKYDQT